MSGQRTFVALAVGLAAVLLASTPAVAQSQSPAQASCLTLLSKRVAKLVKVQGDEIDACTYDLARSGGNRFACMTSDSQGRIAKAAQKLAETDLQACAAIPDFGYAGSASLIAAATAHRIALVETSTSLGGLNADDADCARLYMKGASKLLTRKLRAFSDCLADGLSAGSIQSAGDVTGCFSVFDESTQPQLAKISSSLGDKMAKRECDPAPFVFCNDGATACAERTTTCRACETLRLAGALTVDCSVVHDGTQDFFCAATCGDGEIGGTESCDDGNRENGDGCDANCLLTGCGNGLPTAGEFCESSYGSLLGGVCAGGTHDGLPCEWNAECTGGFCTSCPNRYSCEVDCGSCGVPTCHGPMPPSGCRMVTGACIGQVCNFNVGACDSPVCGTEGNCRIDGYCVPTTPAACDEYEGVPGSCTLGF